MTLSDLPHLDTTSRARTAVLLIGLILAMIGLLLWSEAQNNFSAELGADFHVPRVVAYLAASLFVAAAGLISAGLVVYGRARARAAAERPAAAAEDQPDAAPMASDGPRRKRRALPRARFALTPEWVAGWPQVLAAILFGATAIAAVVNGWGLGDEPALSAQAQQVFGGLLIMLAFPFLVLERIYANTAPGVLPDAPQLERLLRVPLVTFIGLGTTSLLLSVGFEWPSWIERAIAVLIGLVALELVLRGVALIFVPVAPIDTRRSVADSLIASLLRLTPPNFTTVGAAVKRQFGIDLSRSWALAFVRRATLPIALGMAVVAWCLTGVTALGLNERAVYERFGAPVAIFGPGLHVHLPWPLGVMRSVELGVVHEIPIVFAPLGGPTSDAGKVEQIPQEADIEDPAPASADRLWDESHPSEASYLIASESQGKQSFQIVNIDLRVVYRVGLSDVAAEDAAYAIADPEALIRAKAGQLLVRYFARYTLLDVLGQSRERFANDFRSELQDRLQDLSTGIEVIAVVVEAIHPPPAAASAYHDVQAAGIVAESQISLRRADAIAAVNSAEQSAADDRNRAVAAAAELVNQAQAESVLFQGDREAYHRDGRVFLFERWLDRLSGALPKSSFIVLDHRLKGAAAPTIDLRSFDSSGTAYQASPPPRPPTTTKPRAQPSQGSRSAPEEDGD
jgi:regulator of protease activity HflC (stomatin/prohibitin superfamily)